jgi:hypothetical protein
MGQVSRIGQWYGIALFETPLLPGWFYPCSAEDICNQLDRLPSADLAGLATVGLVASTRKNCSAYARYCPSPSPTIFVYSYPDTLSFKLAPHTPRGCAESSFTLQREFGMRLEAVGARLYCRWDPDDLRRYMLEYTLVHEVGHHVQWIDRWCQELKPLVNRGAMEQFAEDYAIRFIRSQGGIGYSDR